MPRIVVKTSTGAVGRGLVPSCKTTDQAVVAVRPAPRDIPEALFMFKLESSLISRKNGIFINGTDLFFEPLFSFWLKVKEQRFLPYLKLQGILQDLVAVGWASRK